MKKAIDFKLDALITHHGPHQLDFPIQGNMAEKIHFATENKLPVYRAHLNLDFCDGGIIDTLCSLLEIPTRTTKLRFGFHEIKNGVRVADYPISTHELLRRVEKLRPATIRMAGPKRKQFHKIAITSGQGFFETFFGQLPGIDLYIAGEFEQEAVAAAQDMDVTLLELTHYASEARPLELIASQLSKRLGVEVIFIETPDSICDVGTGRIRKI